MEGMGITPEQSEHQIETFRRGVPFTPLLGPCTIDHGLQRLDASRLAELTTRFEKAQAGGCVTKFVPASGAASRMFKALHGARERLAAGEDVASSDLDTFMEHLSQFAFYAEIEEQLKKMGKQASDRLAVLDALLDVKGMNYSNLPKGLLTFHRHEQGTRTPVEEHLAEAAAYAAASDGRAQLHFTVSPEHIPAFEAHLAQALPAFEASGLNPSVSFSVQKESTNTIAVDLDNKPFRDDNGRLLFRPAGHGALIENLGDLNGDIVFIKNVDNVVPDHLKPVTITYKKALGGLLLEIQDQVFNYLRALEAGAADEKLCDEILAYAESHLGRSPAPADLPEELAARQHFLTDLLNRPIRVCGMVENVGEPGGGPFWVDGGNGAKTIQIVESSQVDKSNTEQAVMMAAATHFNPVDLICSVRDFHGAPFDLTRFVDPLACFISEKSYAGRSLKALELPGLWNGAMAEWNTCFAEVPLITFNPVKTINDLLREQHR